MIINTLLVDLELSSKPLARSVIKGEGYSVLAIGFKREMVLKEHKTSIPAKLIIIYGKIEFVMMNEITILNKFDEHEIPVNVLHELRAVEESLCFLMHY